MACSLHCRNCTGGPVDTQMLVEYAIAALTLFHPMCPSTLVDFSIPPT
jgi:hypothetical protein